MTTPRQELQADIAKVLVFHAKKVTSEDIIVVLDSFKDDVVKDDTKRGKI